MTSPLAPRISAPFYCPDPAHHHLHAPPPPPPEPPLADLLRAEFERGNYSIRGLAHRYEWEGADRGTVRYHLWKYDPAYMDDYDRRMGPDRPTNQDHAGNRARRRHWPAEVASSA